MGYCTDKSCMALVYEYMQEGNLQDKLKGDENKTFLLSLFQNFVHNEISVSRYYNI
jgi:hypothetical protein